MGKEVKKKGRKKKKGSQEERKKKKGSQEERKEGRRRKKGRKKEKGHPPCRRDASFKLIKFTHVRLVPN